jgi:glycosyltransferase involved in cell wall biosynthesis
LSQLISIITPIYNGQEFLKETIETVLNQSYSNWELLLIDDGSTDNSKAICKTYTDKDNRIKYYYKSNGGQASARNLGIKKAKGEWIALLDADDLWHNTKLEKQIEILDKNSEATLCFTNTLAFQNTINNELYNFDNKAFGLLNKDFFLNVFVSSYVSNSSLVIKKNVIVKSGLYNESEIVRGSEDWELLLRLLYQKNRIVGVKEKLLYYRVHDGGIHLQNARMFIGKTKVYAQYKDDKRIPKLIKLKQLRYTYRELANYLFEENRQLEIVDFLSELWQFDKYSFGTLKQKITFKMFSIPFALKISNKLIYRVAYRLEKIRYFVGV